MTYTFQPLNYSYDALEPHYDARTMEIHHSLHHKGYFTKFMNAIEGTDLMESKIEDIFANISKHSNAVKNNGGGFYNHNVYWNSLSPNGGGLPTGSLLEAIEKKWGSVENFKTEFATAATTQFGSGWAWLIRTDDGGLEITQSSNQENPLMDTAKVKGTPLLVLDVWEHAYYLKFQNRRPDHVATFWNVVNWDYAQQNFTK